jgi:hypothetical protein
MGREGKLLGMLLYNIKYKTSPTSLLIGLVPPIIAYINLRLLLLSKRIALNISRCFNFRTPSCKMRHHFTLIVWNLFYSLHFSFFYQIEDPLGNSLSSLSLNGLKNKKKIKIKISRDKEAN